MTISSSLRLGLLGLLATTALSIVPSYAEDKPTTNTQGGVVYSPLLPAKIHPKQTTADGLSIAAANVEKESGDVTDDEILGLVENASDGALLPTLWKGLSRSELSTQLSNANASSPTLVKLLRRALISKTDKTALSADPAPEAPVTMAGANPSAPPIPTPQTAKPDLYEIRVKKLLDLGFYRDAFQMYRTLGDHGATNATTAKLGVLSMIGSGQLGTACLENRVIPADKKLATDEQLWKELGQFCDALLSPASAQDKNEFDALGRASRAYAELNVLKTIGSMDQLKALSPINLMALHRSGRIGKGVLTEQNFASMPASTLSALYAVTPPRSDEAYAMLSHLIRRGLKSGDDLVSAYKNHAQALRKQSQAQGRDLKKGTKVKESAWTNLALIYADLISADQSAPPATLIKSALTAGSTLPAASLIPFARAASSLESFGEFTDIESKKLLWGMLVDNISPPIPLITKAYPTESQGINASNGESLLLKILLKDAGTGVVTNSSTTNLPPTTPAANGATPTSLAPQNTGKSGILLEREMLEAYFMGEPNVIKTAKIAYDNNFSLTGSGNYVMHNPELGNNLSQFATNGELAKVILKSINAAQNAPATAWDEQTFSAVLNGLYSVGLGEDVKSLIRERMIGKLQ